VGKRNSPQYTNSIVMMLNYLEWVPQMLSVYHQMHDYFLLRKHFLRLKSHHFYFIFYFSIQNRIKIMVLMIKAWRCLLFWIRTTLTLWVKALLCKLFLLLGMVRAEKLGDVKNLIYFSSTLFLSWLIFYTFNGCLHDTSLQPCARDENFSN